MRRRLMTWCVIAAALFTVETHAAAQGQQPPPTARPSQTAPPARPSAVPAVDVPPQPAPSGQQTPRPPGAVAPQPAPAQSVWQNIRIDLTITDAANATTQLRKVLVLHIADGRQGQVRSQGEQGLINVDARPQVRPDGKTILLQLTVEYRQGVNGSLFSESVSAMVTDGKPLVLSQTADPSGDRKVSVEVLATIQKN
jgi:hypothetical protein